MNNNPTSRTPSLIDSGSTEFNRQRETLIVDVMQTSLSEMIPGVPIEIASEITYGFRKGPRPTNPGKP
jgi:hypothetical protein